MKFYEKLNEYIEILDCSAKELSSVSGLSEACASIPIMILPPIPMYMTGQISPYYLKNVQNNAFIHLLKVSGGVALSGEAISGCHSDGKYYLTKSKEEVA